MGCVGIVCMLGVGISGGIRRYRVVGEKSNGAKIEREWLFLFLFSSLLGGSRDYVSGKNVITTILLLNIQ